MQDSHTRKVIYIYIYIWCLNPEHMVRPDKVGTKQIQIHISIDRSLYCSLKTDMIEFHRCLIL